MQEAIERTRTLLFPFRLGFWLRLALVAMLLGTGGGGGSGGGSGGGQDSGYGSDTGLSTQAAPPMMGLAAPGFLSEGLSGGLLGGSMLLIAAVVAAAVVFILVLMYLSSVSVFVFVKALASGDLKLIEYYKSQAGRGLSLFLFEFAVLIVILALILAAILVGVGFFSSVGFGFTGILLIILAVFAAVAIVVVVSLLLWLVTELAAPIMYATGCGLIEAMRRVKELASSGLWQFVVFLAMRIGFGLIGAVVQFVVQLIFLIPVLAVLFLFGFGAAILGGPTAPLMSLAMLALIPVLIVIRYVTSFVTLPVTVFLRYYSLLFLARMNPAYSVFAPAKPEPGEDESSGKVKVY